METATFAAGCFWGVEAAFAAVPGVRETRVGYTGGATERPTYRAVCGGATGHAEAVRVTFDPARVTYDALLAVFWRTHDPTARDRQGPDVGTQYRSAVFWHTDAQRAAAERSLAAEDASGRHARPIATQLAAAGPFTEAEEYHQRYLEKNKRAVCH